MEPDFADVRGQDAAIEALAAAAAARLDVLLVASPGTGATLLARRLAGILPEPAPEERAEIAEVYERGFGADYAPPWARPFRAPHHTVSLAGMVGTPTRPGELALARHGVLFLDDVVEFRPDVLRVVAARTREPGRPMIVGSVALCSCGEGPGGRCACTEESRARHTARLEKISSLFQVFVYVPRRPAALLQSLPPGPESADLRRKVTKARRVFAPATVAAALAALRGSQQAAPEDARIAGRLMAPPWR